MTTKTALKKVTDQAEETALDAVQQNHIQEAQKNVHLAMGALGGMRLVSKFIGVSMIKLLQQIRDKEDYEAFGFDNFKDFLEKSDIAQQYAGISYRTFNNLENQLKAEGDEIYDLLNEFKIPISTRQLLSDGEIKISVDGDNLQVGNEIINLSEKPDVKQIFKDLAKDVRKLNEDKTATAKKVEDLTEQLKTGQQEYEELQRAMDAKSEGSKYEQALAKTIAALINLKHQAEQLPLVETQARGRNDIEALWQQMLLVRSALYQDDFAFTEAVKVEKKGISQKAMQLLAENSDFGDDSEQ